MENNRLPPNTYLQSYLKKAGIKFSVNIVDTIYNKGLSLSFYIFLVLLIYFLSPLPKPILPQFVPIIDIAISFYILFYLLRFIYFYTLRLSLRKQKAPLSVEAYAVVQLDDLNKGIFKKHKPKKFAIIYKECGSKNPRFFTSAIKVKGCINFNPGQIAVVYINRKNPKLYSIDDISAFKAVTAKAVKLSS